MNALEFVGTSDMALEKASTISQGDLKKLEFARAVATGLELLLLASPFFREYPHIEVPLIPQKVSITDTGI